jgi:Fe-S oxidoreductase
MKLRLDWSSYEDAGLGDAYADIPKQGGDFAKAVAACINSHRCEADSRGVMCPSFRVSKNPNLSTGGRVRLLKQALNAAHAESALLDDELLAEAMDLCVACKGCKRECENNVDMALIKTEYLAQRNMRQRPGLRSRLFAHLPRWLHRYPWLSLLVRWRNRSSWLSKSTEKWLGIDSGLHLPEATQPFIQSRVSSPVSVLSENRLPEVVLLIDTFTRHYEPDIAEAALRVLEAGRYQVTIATTTNDTQDPERPLCCGRSYLAQGMIDEARYEANRMLDALLPHVRAGRLVIGLEPSCLLGLRDDYLAMRLGEKAREVAGTVLLFEEFLAKELMAKRLKLPLKPLDDKLGSVTSLVHGHCHQKAVGAMKSMRKVLKLIPGHSFNIVDAGCCGMAGSFGLEREHSEISQAMAQLSLWPALDEQPEARVIANGFSCRQQIQANDDRPSVHIAQLLRDALDVSEYEPESGDVAPPKRPASYPGIGRT